MHQLLQKMIHKAKQHPNGLPKDVIKDLTKKYESLLSLATEEYLQNPPSKDYMDGYNLHKRMKKYPHSALSSVCTHWIERKDNFKKHGIKGGFTRPKQRNKRIPKGVRFFVDVIPTVVEGSQADKE